MRRLLVAVSLIFGLFLPVSAQAAPPVITLDEWTSQGIRFWDFQGCSAGGGSCHQTRVEAGVFRKNSNPSEWWYAWSWESTHNFYQAATLGDFTMEYRNGGYAPYLPNSTTSIAPTVCLVGDAPCLGQVNDTGMWWQGQVLHDVFFVTGDNDKPLELFLDVQYVGAAEETVAMSLVRTAIVSEPSVLVGLLTGVGALLVAGRRRRIR
jgi:hypothetical protein